VDADEYFRSHERLVSTVEQFDDRCAQVDALSRKTASKFFWRGQADATWGVHSSLHRAVRSVRDVPMSDVTEAMVAAAESELIEVARPWIRPSVGARLTTVDLFARLQHHGVPTRLVDFTTDPYVALYFAAVEHPDADGRLFAAAARSQVNDEFRNDFALPWRAKSPTRPSDWSSSLFALDDQDDFLRISRQRGVFLTGGTPSTQPWRRTATGVTLKAVDVRSSMSLPLALHSWGQAEAAEQGRSARGRKVSFASALTIRIPASAKAPLCRELETKGYSLSSLFPDPDGLKSYEPFVRGLLGSATLA
jgi:hypothetical protein